MDKEDLFFIINTIDKDKNIMNKKMILEKYKDKESNNVECSISFILEVNKWKTNIFHTYLGKSGSKQTYQIYSQSI